MSFMVKLYLESVICGAHLNIFTNTKKLKCDLEPTQVENARIKVFPFLLMLRDRERNDFLKFCHIPILS